MGENTINLDNKIRIDDQIYDINAKHSDTADVATQVAKSLTLRFDTKNQSNKTANTSTIEFDGSAEIDTTIEIMTPAGGTFTGNVKLPNPGSSDIDIPNNATVANKIDDITKGVKGLPLLNWTGSALETITIDDNTDNPISPLKVVIGELEELVKFQDFIDRLTASSMFFNNYFIYIAFSSSNSSAYPTMYLLHKDMNTVNTVPIASKYLASLENSNEYFTFDDLKEELDRIDKAIADLKGSNFNGSTYTTIAALSKNLEDNADAHSSYTANINDINSKISSFLAGATYNGTLYKAKKAAEADQATQATKATQDSEGLQINYNYYRSNANTGEVNKIYIQTAEPTNPKNGDIWIYFQ